MVSTTPLPVKVNQPDSIEIFGPARLMLYYSQTPRERKGGASHAKPGWNRPTEPEQGTATRSGQGTRAGTGLRPLWRRWSGRHRCGRQGRGQWSPQPQPAGTFRSSRARRRQQATKGGAMFTMVLLELGDMKQARGKRLLAARLAGRGCSCNACARPRTARKPRVLELPTERKLKTHRPRRRRPAANYCPL